MILVMCEMQNVNKRQNFKTGNLPNETQKKVCGKMGVKCEIFILRRGLA